VVRCPSSPTATVMETVDTRSAPARDAEAPDAEGVHGEDADQDIITLIQRGERAAALTSLMRRHGVAVYRYCREELHDRTLADDVHQQIFIQAHRDLDRFAARSTLRTWLFAIARHRVLDAAKSRRRAQAHIEEDDTADTPDPSPPPGERLDEARLQHALIECLRKLGEHVRATLVLRYQQGFTFEELGAVFGEKPGTLQARVMRALPLLRACIEVRTGGNV
jgi:RNA polymerase sigma factor (sigma-70 family)